MQILTQPTAPSPTANTSWRNLTTLQRITLQTDINRMNLKLISGFRISWAAASWSRLRVFLMGVIICCCAELPFRSVAVGYSYSRFVGPVTGPEHKVLVYDEPSGAAHVDYVAKPQYEFAYGVEDGPTQVVQNRQEMRDGDVVKGVYSVVDPDGSLRVVKYTADNVHGFQAEIVPSDHSSIHGHDEPTADGVIWQPLQALNPPRVQQHVVHHAVSGPTAADGDGATATGDQQEEYEEVEEDDIEDAAQQNLKMHNEYKASENESGDDSESDSKSFADDADSYEDAVEDEEEDDYEYGESFKDTQTSETDSDEYY